MPFSSRFEHTHIVAGSGHGKTQLLQQMILRDLNKLAEGQGSVILIDSQGDLLRTILSLASIMRLSDRLVFIDPTDIDNPPALNLFDFGLERLTRYSPLEREKLLNGAIDAKTRRILCDNVQESVIEEAVCTHCGHVPERAEFGMSELAEIF